jgi:hypothetical protein
MERHMRTAQWQTVPVSQRGIPRTTGALLALTACLLSARPAGAVTATPMPVSVDIVTLQVVNALSQQPLTGLAVMAKQRTGTSYAWFASGTTDATGRATFKLTGSAPACTLPSWRRLTTAVRCRATT